LINTQQLLRRLIARLKHNWPTECGDEKRVTPHLFSFCNNIDATKVVIGKLKDPTLSPTLERASQIFRTLLIQSQEKQPRAMSPIFQTEDPQLQDAVLAASAQSPEVESSSMPATPVRPFPMLQPYSGLQNPSDRRLRKPGLASKAKTGIRIERLIQLRDTNEYTPLDRHDSMFGKQKADGIEVAEGVMKVAARSYRNGKEVATLLLDRRGADAQITEEVVKAAAGNYWNGNNVMALLLDQRGADVQITRRVHIW
jgi:hypothetical protein